MSQQMISTIVEVCIL